MAYNLYTRESSFYWDSPLTAARKHQIINRLKEMSDSDMEIINDLLDDVKRQAEFDAAETHADLEWKQARP